jgi:tetratricopeptide (TPR) repeat protein
MQAAALAFAEGAGHFKKGACEVAVVSLERAISCQHDLPEAHFLLGLVHEKCGRLEDAGDCLLLATTFRPDFADAWFQLGVVDMARGRAVDAERNFDAALRNSSSDLIIASEEATDSEKCA